MLKWKSTCLLKEAILNNVHDLHALMPTLNDLIIMMMTIKNNYLSRGCLHEISFRVKWNIFISVSGQFLVTAYMIQPETKLIADVTSLRPFREKWNFISGDKISCTHYPKWNHMKRNICTCVKKNDWLLLNEPFISDHPRNDIHFISPTMKSNANGISLMMDWDFVSARFLFRSHVNTL